MTEGSRPQLTVVIPTLGTRLDWLRLNLESIRRQDIPIDVIAVAPPGSHAGLTPLLAAEGGRVVAQRSAGLTAAINEGFAAATTPFVSWLGDDDVLVPDTAGSLVRLLERHPDSPFAYGRMLLVDVEGCYMWTIRPTRFAPSAARVMRNFVPQQGTVFRASALRAIGGADETLRFAMDLDLWLRLRRLGRPVYLPRPVGVFRWHPGGLTMGNESSVEEAQAVRLAQAPPWLRPVVSTGRRPLHFAYKVVHKLGVMRRDQAAEDLARMVGVVSPR